MSDTDGWTKDPETGVVRISYRMLADAHMDLSLLLGEAVLPPPTYWVTWPKKLHQNAMELFTLAGLGCPAYVQDPDDPNYYEATGVHMDEHALTIFDQHFGSVLIWGPER